MTSLAIITGTSRGIGFALTEELLDKGFRVIGLGRTNAWKHPNYTHITVDLTKIDAIETLKFPELLGYQEVWLINNAGQLGEIARIAQKKENDYQQVMHLNATVPMELTHKVRQYMKDETPFILLNISSGAGRRSIPGWAAYCASKAALDSFSATFSEEEKELTRPTRVFSIAPGVVDTSMQKQIRESESQTFSSHQAFIELYETNKLLSITEVAVRIIEFVTDTASTEVIGRI